MHMPLFHSESSPDLMSTRGDSFDESQRRRFYRAFVALQAEQEEHQADRRLQQEELEVHSLMSCAVNDEEGDLEQQAIALQIAERLQDQRVQQPHRKRGFKSIPIPLIASIFVLCVTIAMAICLEQQHQTSSSSDIIEQASRSMIGPQEDPASASILSLFKRSLSDRRQLLLNDF